eukprot:gene11417-13306_t
MQVVIEDLQERSFVGVRSVGPYAKTVKPGFEKLTRLCKANDLPMGGDMMAVYYDNPEIVPECDLKVDCAVVIPDTTARDIPTELVKGKIKSNLCAVTRAIVTDGDFASVWRTVLHDLLPKTGYKPSASPCYEVYRNSGENNKWIIDIIVPVIKK